MVSYVPGEMQERTFLGQEKNRTNPHVSQSWGIQEEQKHKHLVEETTWCWDQRKLSKGKAQDDDKLFSVSPVH